MCHLHYSRTGTSNNTITTGSLTFDLEPGDGDGEHPNVDGEDSFPQTTPEGSTNEKNETDFDVSGTLPESASPVKYYVYAIQGEDSAGKTRFDPSYISMKLDVSGTDETSTVDIETDYKTGAAAKAFSVNTGDNQMGFLLATGKVANTGSLVTHKYKLHMWINETATVSDTDYSYKFRASSTEKGDSPLVNGPEEHDSTKMPNGTSKDERKVYSDMYYSVKIKVVASDDPAFTGTFTD